MLPDPVESEMLLIENFLSAAECQAILSELDALFQLFSKEREKQESFGDFAVRKQLI